MRHFLPLLLACLLGSFVVPAQNNGNLYLEDSALHIYEGGALRSLAWCGGFSNPQFAMADLNHDGLKDMVIYEWRDRTVRTFLNVGTPTAAVWQYAPHYALNFTFPGNVPDIVLDYLKLEDYNRDGIPDLIQKGLGGFMLFKGYYNSANELAFKFFKNLSYQPPSQSVPINVYSQASDIPGVVDIDGDGDLDFFAYDILGGQISFFKNCQVERGLPPDSVVICNPTNCWGHVFQTYLRSYILGFNCSTVGTYNCFRIAPTAKETRHAGNCMLLFDADGDGDMDLLDGNISFNDIQYLTNGRAQNGGTDSMIRQDTLWQAGGHQVFLPREPSPFYVDADGDGKRDLLITPHDVYGVENYKTIQFFKNTGTATSPVFTYQSDTFLVDKTIDAGSASYPVLYDYNRDGKPDLFVGSDGYYDNASGTLRSRISYYQNGGGGNLSYLTGDFASTYAQNFAGAAPAFGDLNGDGKDDMVIGHTDGTLSFYKNTATSNTVQPVWVLDQKMLKSTANDTINVGSFAAPYVYDINKDGKPDLLIGSGSGNITWYSSAATGTAPVLTFMTDTLGSFLADTANNFRTNGYASIWIGKMDNTGNEFLLSGNYHGNIVRYTGFGGGNVTTPYTLVDGKYSGIQLGYRSTVTVGDIDGDGRYDMIVGNSNGGLNLYSQGPRLSVGGPAAGSGGCSIAPNPASNSAVVRWESGFAGGRESVQIGLYNALGQQVAALSAMGESGSATLPLAGLPAGIYVCRVETERGRSVAMRLSVMR